MAYAEKLVKSWRACWRANGRLQKQSGFSSKKAALEYGHDQEADIRRRGTRAAHRSESNLEEFAQEWYNSLDLEPSTMRRYAGHLENHILPQWGDWLLKDLNNADTEVARWVKRLDDAGYAPNTRNMIRWMLHTLCADAIDQGHMWRNPASTKRSRGRIAPKRMEKQKEREQRTITTPLGALLIAERCAVLTGRADEFVLVITLFYTGARWAEANGIERKRISPRLHIRKQLAPNKSRMQFRDPKDGSARPIDVPPFLAELLAGQDARVAHPEVKGRWCPCGEGEPERYRHAPGIHLFSAVKGKPHWTRGTFGERVFSAAARGLHYPGQPQQRPVYVDPPGEGRELGLLDRATRHVARPDLAVACWAPIAPGLRLHGLRHSHKTLLEELGTPPPLMNERMGHSDSSVQARYSHPTARMRERLMDGLGRVWKEALAARAAMDPHSPVAVVDGLLEPYRERCSRSAPDPAGYHLRLARGIVA